MNTNQTTKHTPGPYSVGRMRMSAADWAGLHDSKHGVVIVQRGMDVLAAVWSPSKAADGDAMQAVLFASAPALLAERDRYKAERDELLAALNDIAGDWVVEGVLNGTTFYESMSGSFTDISERAMRYETKAAAERAIPGLRRSLSIDWRAVKSAAGFYYLDDAGRHHGPFRKARERAAHQRARTAAARIEGAK